MPAVATLPQPSESQQLGPEDMITVFLGKEFFAPSVHKDNPNVQFLTADSNLDLSRLRSQVSPTTKLFVFTDKVPDTVKDALIADSQKRNHKWCFRPDAGKLTALLDRHFPRGPKAVPLPAADDPNQRGKMKRLLEQFPPGNDTVAEEGRKLFAHAQRIGVATSIPSCQQTVRNYKRERQSGAIPASARPKLSQSDTLKITLKDSIAQLQLALEHAERQDARISQLERWRDGVLGVLNGAPA